MDFTALNNTGGWIALGGLGVYVVVELAVQLYDQFIKVDYAAPEAKGKLPESIREFGTPLANVLHAFLYLIPSLAFLSWYFIFGGHDQIFRLAGKLSGQTIWVQGFMELLLLLFIGTVPFLAAEWIQRKRKQGFKPTELFAFLKKENKGKNLLTLLVMAGLVLFVCWLFLRFPLVLNGLVALFIFIRLFRKTDWYYNRSFKGVTKSNTLGDQDERHKLISAWLSRVGSGITAVYFQHHHTTGAFVRSMNGNKVMVIQFSRYQDAPPSEELILYCARALVFSRSAYNTGRSITLLLTGIGCGLIYFWGATTGAMAIPFQFSEPAFVPAYLLTISLTLVAGLLPLKWLTFKAYKKRLEETDAFIWQYTDNAVHHVLKSKLEKQLAPLDIFKLPNNRVSVWPSRTGVQIQRLKKWMKLLASKAET